MPLLRKKPFVKLNPPPGLKATDEVFLCELTNEVFLDYESFYQRMILCNSLVWSCEYTNKTNLTFKEAQESEEAFLDAISLIPYSLKFAILMLIHHTRRSNVKHLIDDVYEYLKNRYQVDELVEVKINDKWCKGKIKEIPESCNTELLRQNENEIKLKSPMKTPSKDKITDKIRHSSPIGHKEQWPDANTLQYTIEMKSGPKKSSHLKFSGKEIRRVKNSFAKDKLKMFVRITCMRSTPSSDDGYWIVMDKEAEKYSLGISSIPSTTLQKKSPKKKKMKNKNKGKEKRDKSDFFAKAKVKKPLATSMKDLPEEERIKELKKLQEKKKKELEQIRLQKVKEKEEEREQQRKIRENKQELKKSESNFIKEFSKPREDLKLEDLKALPTFVPFKCSLEQELVGDVFMVVEFTNIFGSLFDLDKEIRSKITFDWLVEALTEHDADGKYFEILKFLLHSYLRVERDENSSMYHEQDDNDSSSDEDNKEDVQQAKENKENHASIFSSKAASSSARAAAAWSMLYQGMALHEITIEPYTLTEILRLHILSSGVRIGGIRDYNEWSRRGQAQLCDDPCVWFRHKEVDIMSKLSISNVFDLNTEEKLKLLVLLVNQCLTLATTRDFIDEAFDKVKELRKKLKDLLYQENKRRKQVASEKWKKAQAERIKLKEEKERLKKEKKTIKTEGNSKINFPSTSEGDSKKTESVVGNNNKVEENGENSKSEKEIQEEKKLKKEEKEQRVEEFYRDKYRFNEQELITEMECHSAIIKEVPLGEDRMFRKYWSFRSIEGIYLDNSDKNEGASVICDLLEKDCLTEDEDDAESEAEEENSQQSETKVLAKIPFEDILASKTDCNKLKDLVFRRYSCIDDLTKKYLETRPTITSMFIDIEAGIDPSRYSYKDSNLWYNITNREQFDTLLTSLNSRGLRENLLKSKIDSKTESFYKYFTKKENEKPPVVKAKPNARKKDPNEIDKTLFKTMDDFIEANLLDTLLEFEERLYVASFGGIHSLDRDSWRSKLEGLITGLIQTPPSSQTNTSSEPMEVDSNAETKVNGLTNGKIGDTSPVLKSLPLQLSQNEDISRCSTPTMEVRKNPIVEDLAEALLQIERDIEMRYLKPPLGEAESLKRERMKELINDKSSASSEEDKKTSSLLRWEESLMSCTSLSQVFVHLSTLDRSVTWDKSIQNVKCRLCRRKGDEESMLLCDGCDRGFHMECLTPPLKKIPTNDWYCNDCRPIEVKRPRRKSVCVEDDTEEEEEDEEDEEEQDEDEDQESGEEEESGDDDDDDDSDESSDDEEEDSDESDAESEHGEACTICNEEGTLILCESCPRSYHIECVYPPIRKVPRGNWYCQICCGADGELPHKKRASTIEKQRAKAQEPAKKSQGRPNRGRPADDEEPVKTGRGSKRTQRSPPATSGRASKRQKLDSTASSQSSQRGFSRQQLKNCSTLMSDIFKRNEAEIFLRPVDTNEVPDYTEFIDKPMDFGTIKQNLNNGKYMELQQFLDDVYLVFTNCETYNPPRTQIIKDSNKLKSFVKQRTKALDLV